MSFLTSVAAMPCCSKVPTSRGPNCSSSSYTGMQCLIRQIYIWVFANILQSNLTFIHIHILGALTCTCAPPKACWACCIAAAIIGLASVSEINTYFQGRLYHQVCKFLWRTFKMILTLEKPLCQLVWQRLPPWFEAVEVCTTDIASQNLSTLEVSSLYQVNIKNVDLQSIFNYYVSQLLCVSAIMYLIDFFELLRISKSTYNIIHM